MDSKLVSERPFATGNDPECRAEVGELRWIALCLSGKK